MQEPRAKAPSQNDIETIVRVVMQRLRSMKAAPVAMLPAGSAASLIASTSAGTLRLPPELVVHCHLGSLDVPRRADVDLRPTLADDDAVMVDPPVGS